AEAARLQAEQEAARIKAEEEAARLKAEQEAAERARAEEAEAARLKAEAEAARIKEEQAAAERARAEAEAARVKAEQEAARIRAEQEAAARTKAEAEAARIKAEQEAARVAAERDAAERAKAEAARKKSEADAAQAAQAAQADITKDTAPAGFQIDLGSLSSMDSYTGADELARPASSEAEKESHAVEQPAKQKAPEVKQDMAAEMARLKAEQEAERLRAEQEARALEEEKALAAEQESAWAEAEQRAEQQSKLDAAQAAKEAALAQAKSKQKSTTIRRRTPLPLAKITAGVLLLVLIAIFVLPLFWPMQEYIAPLEQRLSERFKQPVKVASLSVSLLPMPKIELGEIKVGAAGELTAPAATLSFDPLMLLSGSKTIKDVALQDVTVNGKELDKVAGWLKGMAGDAQFPLEHVTLRNLKIVTDGLSVPLLQGGADFERGEFSRLVLHSEDEKFNVELKTVANRTQIAFGIRDDALPLLPSAKFSSFNARGEISTHEINISDLDAHAYGGIWSGKGKLNWSRGWKFEANVQAKTMELSELFPQYGLSGEVFVDGELSASSSSLSNLAKSLRIDASFEAKRGVINGIDMVETARLVSHEHLVGGRTHFDELNGSFVAEDGYIRFRSVRIVSGMLKASGTFEAAADGRLTGAFNSEIKMRSGNNPLSLSGSLAEPRLLAR
ncbi:MAG: AsmA-like C-terminal region-containing protein, partial [Sideroxydans sp.]|nr:AsmA-like C-terminal region-containing protein [Sideroxydans sp.]